MYLAKSCAKRHNLKTSDTLMLGSLYYYRAAENSEIADGGEGKATYELSITGPLEVEKKWLNFLLVGAVGYASAEDPPRPTGMLDIKLHKYRPIKSRGDSMLVDELRATIKRDSYNEFIFCMSLVEDPAHAADIFKSYEDYWIIPASRAQAMADALAAALDKAVRQGRATGKHVIDPSVSFDDLVYVCRHESVTYAPRDLHITSTSQVTAEEFASKVFDIAFLKPPRFSPEKEYRFSYMLAANGILVDFIPDKLLLDARLIRQRIL